MALMDFITDLEEFIAFANCISAEGNNGCQLCVSRITEPTDDEYLNERASFFIDSLNNNEPYKKSLEKLENFCSQKDKDCSICPVRLYCNHYINEKRWESENAAYKMVDLFCGAGGLSLGFSQEGFVTVLANDIEECCVDTYAHNHPETPHKYIILGDIKVLSDNIQKYIGSTHVDLVVGGPPCQGFSMANRQRIIDDPRNHLYKEFVNIVSKLKPTFFVMENVKGMQTVAQQVVEDFWDIGYIVSYRVLNAKDYGVPQNRERLIYIGNNVGINNRLLFDEIVDSSFHVRKYLLKDALYGLRELKASNTKNNTKQDSEESGRLIERNIQPRTNDYIDLINQRRVIMAICNHKARYNNERDIEIFGRLNPGDKSDDPKIADIMPYQRRNGIFRDKYYKLDPNKICKTITAHMKYDCNMYIHPFQARGLTPREAARIQSYPDDYYFRGSFTKTYMQIGNSVPPLLGRALAVTIKKYLQLHNESHLPASAYIDNWSHSLSTVINNDDELEQLSLFD